MTTKIRLVLVVASILILNMVTVANTDNSGAMVNKPVAHYSDSTPDEDIISIPETAIPQKLRANFRRNFPAAANTKWTRSGPVFFANFSMNGNTAMATFNSKGKLNHALIYESGSDLPLFIQQMIHKNYASYTISSVTEIRKRGIINYQVILADNKQYLDLRITQDGHIQQAKQMKMPS